MDHWGHPIERFGLGTIFIWFGFLKVAGETSATSIIAKTVYFGDPAVTVAFLGFWEAAIGLCFIFRPANRVAILLLLIRLPGTALALVLSADQCFEGSPLTPTIQGQYLLKEITLIGAALVIGGTLRARHGDPDDASQGADERGSRAEATRSKLRSAG
jgi:hypothetical protein